MECPHCGTANPDVARYCFRCGTNQSGGSGKYGRGGSYAVQSAERVTQLALVSTVMPHTNRDVADNYRWAVIVVAVAILGFTLAGLLPMAILSAAFFVPLTYLVYLYDVNVWEDAPARVVASLFLLTGVLSLLISLVFFQWVFEGQFRTLLGGSSRGGLGGVAVVPILIFAVLLPLVTEVAKNLGPIYLVTRPQFDDMIDGLTFGVASGSAYAAFETLVAFFPVVAGEVRTTDGLSSWVLIVLNLMLVKSLIYGTATGIAMAAFSGRGEGYDGFRRPYFLNFAFAVGANVLYWLGVRLLSFAPFGQALGLLWGLVILAALIIRIRVMLHAALLEAAVEDVARQHRPNAATTESGFCPECEMPLMADSLFCIVCGSSVRATSSFARRQIREAPVTR